MSIFPIHKDTETCARCFEPVVQKKAVWLELNLRTGFYCEPGTVPQKDTQGSFAFGLDCAKALRAERDTWTPISLTARSRA